MPQGAWVTFEDDEEEMFDYYPDETFIWTPEEFHWTNQRTKPKLGQQKDIEYLWA